MTAPEFSDAEMIAWSKNKAFQYDFVSGQTIIDDNPALQERYKIDASIARAIAARLSATSGDWQPPEESERPDGYKCLGLWSRRWVVVEWTDVGHAETKMGWCSYPYGHSVITPAAFAPLPPTPTHEAPK